MKKRLLPLFLALFMACSIAFMLPACALFESGNEQGNAPTTDQDGEQDEDQDGDQGNDHGNNQDDNDNIPAEPAVPFMKAADKYVAEPVKNVLLDMTSYRDNEYFYYIFHLGEHIYRKYGEEWRKNQNKLYIRNIMFDVKVELVVK